MKKTASILISAVLLSGIGFLEWKRREVIAEHAGLNTSAMEAESLRARLSEQETNADARRAAEEISRLREENRELLKLRNEVRQLRDREPELKRLQAENARLQNEKARLDRSGEKRFQPIIIPVQNLSNQGWHTPEAAVQTYFWGLRDGNLAIVKQSVIPARVEHPPIEGPRMVSQWQREVRGFFEDIETIEIVVLQQLDAESARIGVLLRLKWERSRKIAIFAQRIGTEWRLHMSIMP